MSQHQIRIRLGSEVSRPVVNDSITARGMFAALPVAIPLAVLFWGTVALLFIF